MHYLCINVDKPVQGASQFAFTCRGCSRTVEKQECKGDNEANNQAAYSSYNTVTSHQRPQIVFKGFSVVINTGVIHSLSTLPVFFSLWFTCNKFSTWIFIWIYTGDLKPADIKHLIHSCTNISAWYLFALFMSYVRSWILLKWKCVLSHL